LQVCPHVVADFEIIDGERLKLVIERWLAGEREADRQRGDDEPSDSGNGQNAATNRDRWLSVTCCQRTRCRLLCVDTDSPP
jgi:hypothetical protein